MNVGLTINKEVVGGVVELKNSLCSENEIEMHKEHDLASQATGCFCAGVGHIIIPGLRGHLK